MKIPKVEAALVQAGAVEQPAEGQAWPEEIEALTQLIERASRQGRISDGQVIIFAASLIYRAISHLPPDRQRVRFDEVMEVIKVLLEQANQTPGDGDAGHE